MANQNNQPNKNGINNNNLIDLSNKNKIMKEEENDNNFQLMKNKSVINVRQNNIINKGKCICTKTGCKKKYCSCYAQGIYCDGCDCKNCENLPPYAKNDIQEQVDISINYENLHMSNNPKTQRVICNCTKSNCMKKYCECYKQGLDCNSSCRCRDCENNHGNNINSINENYNSLKNNLNLKNENINSNNNADGQDYLSILPDPFRYQNNIDYNNPINYQPEAFGICIKKGKLKEKERNIVLEIVQEINLNHIDNKYSVNNEFIKSPTFTGRKKNRAKSDNSNMRTCPTSKSSRKRNGISNVNKNIQKKKLQLN